MLHLKFIPKSGLKGIFVFLFLLSNINSQAQETKGNNSKDFKYSVSSPYPEVDGYYKNYFCKGEFIIAFKQARKGLKIQIAIQKFSKTGMNLLSVKEYNNMPAGYWYEGFVQIGEKLYLIFNLWDKKNKKELLLGREIDYEKGEFAGEDKLLLTIDGKIKIENITESGKMSFSKFEIHNCLDSTKFMIQYIKKPESNNEEKNFDIVGFFVFDTNLNKIWGREVIMPYSEMQMDVLDYSLDSKGNVYVLSKVFKTNSNKEKDRDGNVNYHIELFQIADSNPDLKVTPIELGEKLYINNIVMFESKSDYMICVGYYNDGGELSYATGLFSFKVINGTEIFDKSMNDIPIDILTQFVSEKSKAEIEKIYADQNDKKTVGLAYLQVHVLVAESDGSFIITGEQNYKVETNTQKYSYSTYYCGNILMAKIDSVGKLNWIQKLPKLQSGPMPRGPMSFKYMRSGEFSYLVYMDNVENLSLAINHPPETFKATAQGYLTGYKINEKTGDVFKTGIFDTKGMNGLELFQFDIDHIFSMNNSEFLVEFNKKNKQDVMIRVEISDADKN